MISLPPEALTVTPRDFGLAYEDVSFASSDGVPLKGWFVPTPSPSEVTLILCHGRTDTRSVILPQTAALALRGGYNLFYFDFRNHGASGRTMNSLGRLESWDVEAALAWVQVERPERARRVGLYGMSMGGAVALITAARRPEFEAVAAESPFTSVCGSIVRFAGLFHHVPAWMVPYTLWWVRLRLGFDPDAWSPERFVARIAPRSLFLLQGGADMRIPPAEGERLYALAGGAQVPLDGPRRPPREAVGDGRAGVRGQAPGFLRQDLPLNAPPFPGPLL